VKIILHQIIKVNGVLGNHLLILAPMISSEGPSFSTFGNGRFSFTYSTFNLVPTDLKMHKILPSYKINFIIYYRFVVRWCQLYLRCRIISSWLLPLAKKTRPLLFSSGIIVFFFWLVRYSCKTLLLPIPM
jgi:hypothetical protein